MDPPFLCMHCYMHISYNLFTIFIYLFLSCCLSAAAAADGVKFGCLEGWMDGGGAPAGSRQPAGLGSSSSSSRDAAERHRKIRQGGDTDKEEGTEKTSTALTQYRASTVVTASVNSTDTTERSCISMCL